MVPSHPPADGTIDDVAAFYGHWAGVYDRIATAPGVGRWRRRAAELVADPGDRVVEMGCGSGANLPYLQETVGQDGYVVGIDVTRPLLERARDRASRWDNVDVVGGDARTPPVGAADAVLATFVSGMFESPSAVVETWCNLVDSGGRVALLDASASTHPLGKPLNPLFGAFTAASAPSSDVIDVLEAPVSSSSVDVALTERVDAARETLTARTHNRTFETFAAGFVGLLAGTVE